MKTLILISMLFSLNAYCADPVCTPGPNGVHFDDDMLEGACRTWHDMARSLCTYNQALKEDPKNDMILRQKKSMSAGYKQNMDKELVEDCSEAQ